MFRLNITAANCCSASRTLSPSLGLENDQFCLVRVSCDHKNIKGYPVTINWNHHSYHLSSKSLVCT